MAVDIGELATELTTDPQGLGYSAHVAAGNVNALYALLNSNTQTKTKPIPFQKFTIWAGENGVLAKFRDLIANGAETDEDRSAAEAMLELVRSDKSEGLDTEDSGVSAMITLLQTGGHLSTGEVTSLGNAAVASCSRVEVLWENDDVATKQDIQLALLE